MRYLLGFLLIFTITLAAEAKGKVKIGDIPPSYVGKTLDGKKIELSEMKGKVVVVTFWATWCPPCLKELPVLHVLQQQVSSDRLQVVAVNYGETRKQMNKLIKRLGDSSVLFTREKRGYARKKFGVKGIPHMLILDQVGNVVHQHIGYGEGMMPVLEKELNALLRKLPRVIENPVVEKKAA